MGSFRILPHHLASYYRCFFASWILAGIFIKSSNSRSNRRSNRRHVFSNKTIRINQTVHKKSLPMKFTFMYTSHSPIQPLPLRTAQVKVLKLLIVIRNKLMLTMPVRVRLIIKSVWLTTMSVPVASWMS